MREVLRCFQDVFCRDVHEVVAGRHPWKDVLRSFGVVEFLQVLSKRGRVPYEASVVYLVSECYCNGYRRSIADRGFDSFVEDLWELAADLFKEFAVNRSEALSSSLSVPK